MRSPDGCVSFTPAPVPQAPAQESSRRHALRPPPDSGIRPKQPRSAAASDMDCGREVRHERSYRFRRPR